MEYLSVCPHVGIGTPQLPLHSAIVPLPPPRNQRGSHLPEPVFLNVYGAQESIPRNEFRQPTCM
jgi:hypothetical protein